MTFISRRELLKRVGAAAAAAPVAGNLDLNVSVREASQAGVRRAALESFGKPTLGWTATGFIAVFSAEGTVSATLNLR